MAALELAFLGGFRARLGSGDELAPPGRKAALLVAYLALHAGEVQTREKLIGLLWSDRGEAQARASLRQELTALRKMMRAAMPPPLAIEGERVSLDPTAVEVDVRAFEALARSEATPDLERAACLYRGPFLDGIVARDPACEQWLAGERERLRDLFLGILDRLLGRQLQEGAFQRATETAQTILAQDPLREHAHRVLMALHAAQGRHGRALRQYQICRELLGRELGVEPEPETERVHQAIRERRASPAASVADIVALISGCGGEPASAETEGASAEQLEADRVANDRMPTACSGERGPAIAVLPFDNLTGDANQEYLADGIVDEITAALSRVRSFFVIARSSTLRYRGRAAEPARIGRELGVRYLLQGSVRISGERIRIVVQLIDAASGASIWADRYDGQRQDIFDLEDRITERTAGAIEPSIRSAEIERARRKRPDNLEAYDYVMRALPHVWALTPSASMEALRLTTEAVRLDPDYARANALAAWCHCWRIGNGWSPAPAESRTEGLRLARTALRLDADDPSVLTMAGAAEILLAGDLNAAAVHIGKALALDPNSAWAWIRSGYIQVYRGNPEIALEHFERASRLSPFDPLNFNRHVGVALAHFVAERYQDAIAWAERSLVERPGLPWAYRVLAAAHTQLAQHVQASDAARALLLQSPDLSLPEIMATMPFQSSDAPRRFADGLREAGIPETACEPTARESGNEQTPSVGASEQRDGGPIR